MTWLWTVNVMHKGGSIARPGPVVARQGYVTWVGLDGYYYNPSVIRFPVRADHRRRPSLTHDPILIAETSAAHQISQRRSPICSRASASTGCSASSGLTRSTPRTGGLNTRAAISAFRAGARTYHQPTR